MAPSTKRGLNWRTVKQGAHVSIPCEGGFVPSSAPEDGVEFNVDGQDSLFVPMSKLQDVIAQLEAHQLNRAVNQAQVEENAKRKGKR